MKFLLFIRGILHSISKSITKKYLIWFSIILIIPILIIFQIIIGYANWLIEEDILKKNMLSTDALAERINSELSDVVLQLQLIAGNDEESEISNSKMYNRAERIISRSAIVQSIYFIDKSHQVLFEAPFSPNLKSQYYFYPEFNKTRVSNNYVVSNMVKNFHGKKVVIVSVPVIDGKKGLKGVLVAEISREYLSSIIKGISTTRSGFSFILDKNGYVISSTNVRDIGKNFSVHPAALRLSKGLSGFIREDISGETSILSYKALWDQWGLVLGVPEKVAFQPIFKLSIALTLSFIGILTLSIFLIVLGTKKLLTPIVRLTQLASHFDEKQSIEELKRVKVDSQDELGILMKKMIDLGISNIEKKKILEEKERYLYDVIEGIPYAILTLDNDGIITHPNLNFERLTGISREELKGKHTSSLPLKYGQADFLSLNSLHIDNPIEEMETYIIDADRRKRIVKVVTSKFYNERKESIGYISVLQDISQLKLFEEQIRQSEKLASIGQVTTGIAHELKNPLAILLSSAELLKKVLHEPANDELVDMLSNDIYDEVKRMSGIVSEFLSFTRMKNEEEKWTEMNQLVDKVLHLLRIKLNEAKVDVLKEYQVNSRKIKVKPEKLMQVFLNLILNSIEAMPTGGILQIHIYEKNSEGQEWLVVEIKDCGQGISKHDLDWLFNPFFSTKPNGSGLGLTIAKDIVNEHNGEMVIQSTIHAGTSIQCKFPITTKIGI
ncbi:ATP-binding protein [Neobacillus drentensis]|uniref:sensor histidine kinase n=1 Tax=Neobacillus drentensis TaxID=220684 RepID=UPI002FFE2E4C